MLDSAIQVFLNDRKKAWLKKKINSNTNDEDRAVLTQQADAMFSLSEWLPNAAKRAGQLFLVSHPGKFSHPSAKISSVIASCEMQKDGLLRTGNSRVELDVFGNAAALDVYKFLSLVLMDGNTILTHLQKNTVEIEAQFTLPNISFNEIKRNFLAIMDDGETATKTSAKIKQVYFPVNDHYHLLSILTPSNIMYGLKDRINGMHFSDQAKEVREAKKKNKQHDNDLSELFNLTVIGFGGTKPQNISVLNNNHGGKAYLLASLPPVMQSQTVRPPRLNFFSDTLWHQAFRDDFKSIHALLVSKEIKNNIHLRNKRDYFTRHIIYQVVDRVWLIRHLDAGWSDLERNQHLPIYQKTWLDQKYIESRYEELDWLPPVKKDFSSWFLRTYQKINGKHDIMLGDEQHAYFKEIISECEEAFR